jgi:putative PIN family toxin of toxin-antitoxin system
MTSERTDKITVVFDTNVFISGYLWNGKARDALRLARSNKYRLLYCRELLDELIRVLSSKFQLEVVVVHKIVQDIQNIGHSIPVLSRDAPITADPTDNLFINLALDGKASCIVSGDSHLLKLKKHNGISIVTVADFLKM